MAKRSKNNQNALLYVAIAAMLLLVYAISFTAFASALQKVLILTGAFVLFLVASIGNQKVLQALQLVIVIGAVIAFLQLTVLYALGMMLFVALLMVAYLFSIEHYKKEPIGFIGSAGFVLLAIGLAFNTGQSPLLTGAALGFGSILVAIYSLAAFLLYKTRLQVVWVILNIAFAISPLLLFFSTLGI